MVPSTSKSNIRLLIVEDNAINRQYLSGLLAKWKLDFDVAEHGQEALDLLTVNVYHLILLDIRMPVMDGYELTRLLRSCPDNQNREIPIIALTASSLVDERERVLSVGMNEHLNKPFTPEQLLEAIGNYIPLGTEDDHVSSDYHFTNALDRGYLEEFYQGDMDRARVLFGIFLEVINKEIEQLYNHYEKDDWVAFVAQAHKIKPNFAMVGLTDLSKQMKIYEAATYDESVRQKIKREIHNLSEKLENGRKIVENELRFISQFQHSS